MKITTIVLLGMVVFAACSNDNNAPDVSHIKVDIPIERFDQRFFNLDTNNLSAELVKLKNDYPDFYPDFMSRILGVSGSDSNRNTLDVSRFFIRGYKQVYDELSRKYKDAGWLKKDLGQSYRYVKYYFPEYKTGKAILFIGPLDAPGIALTGSGVAIGLQQFAGKDFFAYQDVQVQQLFPAYISRRFEPQFIVANCMKAVASDIYPDRSGAKGLIEQMIEKGKQWWLLDKFLPKTADSIKTGYTKQQLNWCRDNEGLIWNDIITTEKDLYTKNPMTLQNYIGEAPYTQSLGLASPGNIGQWIGWQIVKKFEEKNPSMKVIDVLKTDSRKIFEQAKYKPK